MATAPITRCSRCAENIISANGRMASGGEVKCLGFEIVERRNFVANGVYRITGVLYLAKGAVVIHLCIEDIEAALCSLAVRNEVKDIVAIGINTPGRLRGGKTRFCV